jgi:nicotinamide-nucleotide amidase
MTAMNAAIIAVGSEMLGTQRLDTNSLSIAAALEKYAVALDRKSVIGDRQSDLVAELRFAARSADLLIVTGGLGPTEDDMTREALAEAFGLKLEVDRSIIEHLEERFASRGMKMPKVNERQANVFAGQTMLPNSRGTAPGFHLRLVLDKTENPGESALSSGAAAASAADGRAEKRIFVFPGVPHEMEGMVREYLEPWLAEVSRFSRYRRVLKIAGLGESAVEEKLAPYYVAHKEPLTILASQGQIELHLQADGEEAAARAEIASREQELAEIFGDRLFGFDDDTLEAVIGRMLIERSATVSTAESCTGGLLASRITDIAGSSAYFLGGAVCYTADSKMFLAGVDPQLIQEHGEVSEEVARDLAKGIRRRFKTTYGVGITGIAGPGGGSEAKPVGTVHIAVADGRTIEHRKLFWPMGRIRFKWFSTQSALDLLRLFMLKAGRVAGSGRNPS